MSVSILFNTLVNSKQLNAIASLRLDATLSENHDMKATVTSNPVEDGTEVSDHIYNSPLEVQIDGLVSNAPITRLGLQEATEDRVQDAFTELERLYEARKPVTIVTGLKVYKSMVMVQLSIPRDRSTGESLRFSAQFRQIKTVKSKSVSIPQNTVADDVKDQAQSSRDTGKQVAREATEQEKNRGEALYKSN